MKIKILRGTVAALQARAPGDIVDVDKQTADYLVRLGKAEFLTDTAVLVEKESAAVEAPENAARPRAAARK